MKRVLSITALSLMLMMSGCMSSSSSKNHIGYNKSAQEWYDAIEKSVYSNDLEKADKEFISFRSEHIDSNLLPDAMLILAFAHMRQEEYLLANFYLDEYLRKYPTGSNGNYARFLKIKAEFLSIKDINREQKQVMKALKDAKEFYAYNRNSIYAPLIATIITRLEMSQYLLNENIASLYTRIGKPKAAQIYIEKNKKYPFDSSQIEAPRGFLSGITLPSFNLGL